MHFLHLCFVRIHHTHSSKNNNLNLIGGKLLARDIKLKRSSKKCIQGKTQNAKETLNALIWFRVPKSIFVGRETIEVGTYSAVIHFNNGRNGILGVLKYFWLIGVVLHLIAKKLDSSQVKHMTRKANIVVKKRRIAIRSKLKG